MIGLEQMTPAGQENTEPDKSYFYPLSNKRKVNPMYQDD